MKKPMVVGCHIFEKHMLHLLYIYMIKFTLVYNIIYIIYTYVLLHIYSTHHHIPNSFHGAYAGWDEDA
jgi:hypothetical protein